MADIILAGNISGSVTIAAPAIAGTTVITLPATTGTLLASGGALGTPSSGALTNCTGLPVAGGGTGVATTTAYGVLAGGTTATGAFQNIGTGTAAQVLTSNGAGALPTFQAASGGVTTFAGGTTGLTPAGATSGAITLAGTLAVANGGTGVATSTGSGANVLGTSPTLTTPTFDSASLVTISGTAPLYMCRAWVNFNGTGTVAIRASGNVSSITDNGTGSYTVNFTTAMTDVNYATAGNCGTLNTTYSATKSTGSYLIDVFRTNTTTMYDDPQVSVIVFR